MQKRDREQVGWSLIVTAIVVVLDQLSKSWIRNNLAPLESTPEVGFFRLTHLQNPGAVFGLPANQIFLVIVTGLAILSIILFFLRYLFGRYPFPVSSLSLISLGLVLAGAIGNLIDRLRFGYVTDFIDVRLWDDFHWPAFNFADAAIVVGILTLVYSLYRSGLFGRVYEHNRRIKD